MRKTFIRSILSVTILLSLAGSANAQIGLDKEYVEPSGWSLGTSIGMSDLWGDVGTQNIIDHYGNPEYFKKPCFMGGMFIRYSFHPSFAARLGGYYGTLYATDMWNKQKAEKASNIETDAYQRYLRNLSVRSNIWEGSLLFEIAPFRFNPLSNRAIKRFQPLLLLGVAAMHFNPQAELIERETRINRGYVNLYDLHIEGDGMPGSIYPNAPAKYELWQITVPMGLGVRWDIGRRLSFGVEWLYRYTFTDYLDNVSGQYINPAKYSQYLPADKAYAAAQLQDKTWLINEHVEPHGEGQQRGNPSVKDAYSTFGFTLIFKVPSKKTPWWY
ncbi:MAG TPA: hypothetical protein VL098_07490 [Flavipsychrobacter sp.]|nr:hypothetical protein [Flavipsychrobacter sp.]